MPTDSPEASGPRKRKLSTKVITNGDPEVERKRKKLETKKQSTKQASTQKLKKAAMKPAPQPQRPSIEVEEVEDESDYHTSVPPHNPKNILEATDGSDDDVVITAPPKKSTKNSVPVITKQRPPLRSRISSTEMMTRLPMGVMATWKILSLMETKMVRRLK
jgi:hypothetical protein